MKYNKRKSEPSHHAAASKSKAGQGRAARRPDPAQRHRATDLLDPVRRWRDHLRRARAHRSLGAAQDHRARRGAATLEPRYVADPGVVRGAGRLVRASRATTAASSVRTGRPTLSIAVDRSPPRSYEDRRERDARRTVRAVTVRTCQVPEAELPGHSLDRTVRDGDQPSRTPSTRRAIVRTCHHRGLPTRSRRPSDVRDLPDVQARLHPTLAAEGRRR